MQTTPRDKEPSTTDETNGITRKRHKRHAYHEWRQIITVNGKEISFKLDTGADVSTMSLRMFTNNGFDKKIVKETKKLIAETSQNRLPIVGVFKAHIKYQDRSIMCNIYVLNVDCDCLLSLDACIKLNLVVKTNNVADTDGQPNDLTTLLEALPGDVTPACPRIFITSKDKMDIMRRATARDKTLLTVKKYFMDGWPTTKKFLSQDLKQFWYIKNELRFIDGIFFWKQQMIVPTILRARLLERVHEGHLGVDMCKWRARQSMWWWGIDRDVEREVGACAACIGVTAVVGDRSSPTGCPQRTMAQQPWEIIAVDIIPLKARNIIVVMDYFSKFIVTSGCKRVHTPRLIIILKKYFSMFGIPKQLILEKHSQFMPKIFKKFASTWEFVHRTPTRYDREFFGSRMEILKYLLGVAMVKKEDPYQVILNFNNTPLSDNNRSPAQLFMSRMLRTRLPTFRPTASQKAELDGVRRILTVRRRKYRDQSTQISALPPPCIENDIFVRALRLDESMHGICCKRHCRPATLDEERSIAGNTSSSNEE